MYKHIRTIFSFTSVKFAASLMLQFAVGIIFFMMRAVHRTSKNGELVHLSYEASNLSISGLAEYPATDKIVSVLSQNSTLIDSFSLKAKRVSNNPPINFYSLSAEEWRLFLPLLSDTISEDLLQLFGNHYVCAFAYFVEYLPYEGKLDSSHVWHTDGYALHAEHHKLFYYLSETDESNGAFEWHTSNFSTLLRRRGFKHRYPARLKQNRFVQDLLESRTHNCQRGSVGSAFIFNPSRIVHRAGPRLESGRRALVIELLPYKNNNPLKMIGHDNLRALTNPFFAIRYWTRGI